MSDGQTASLGNWTIEAFYDGACPLCVREVRFLRRLDRKSRIRFTDIASKNFCPDRYKKPLETFMSEIQGRLPDGTWVSGVEVFRRLYAAVGLGPLVWLTRLPLIRRLLDWGYGVFARNRLRLTGRCSCGSCPVDLSKSLSDDSNESLSLPERANCQD